MSFKWSDYITRAQSRGLLAKQLFMVLSKPAVPLEEMADVLPDHLEYQKKREADGTLFMAGPLGDEQGENWSGIGLIIYRAASLAEAQALAAEDPMHKTGKKTPEVRPWLVNEGSIQISVPFSTQKARVE